MNTKNKELADLLFPHITKTRDYYENLYPKRKLSKGAEVTRFAPSPTGYMHIGNFFSALLDRMVATQTKGVFFLRIEDTDQKRQLAGATEVVLEVLDKFGINMDEGIVSKDKIVGDYGPYTQSERKEIYQTYIKWLIEKGRAYPCFCLDKDLEAQKQTQKDSKKPTGYYNEYAICRNLKFDEIKENIKKGLPFVIRLKSKGVFSDNLEKRTFFDEVKGERIFPKNYRDAVILKSNGLPLYSFAHAVDDFLMGTTLVIRGEEWFASLAEHLEIFEALEIDFVKYAHTPLIQKLENDKKRKISKRKDPEADMRYYLEQGYMSKTIIEYLLTLASSGFEDWQKNNPEEPYLNFLFKIANVGVSSPLFDIDKLNNISKNNISNLTTEQLFDSVLAWAKEYDTKFYNVLTKEKDYALGVFNIEKDATKKRKDIYKWAMVYDFYKYMFEAPQHINWKEILPQFEIGTIKSILLEYVKHYDELDEKQEWFEKIKNISPKFGFAKEVKDYKKSPQDYLGHCGDVSTIIRVALTGRTNTPDLHEISRVLGKSRVTSRLIEAAK